MKTISIIVPVYQNEENLPHTIPKLLSLREQLRGYSFELLFVDDGSTDGSFEELKKFQERNPDAIHLIRLSRNFGQTPAIQAGLRHASGNCVGIISADLQEPYQKFVDMVRIWEGGKKFIFGERVSREEKASHQFFSNLYWKMIRRFSMGNFPQAGYDFCLMDRQVVEDLNKINEKNTSIFALIFWLGYQPTALKIDRKLRKAGVSQWPLLKKIR
ncbi:MAG: glycosyltransferase family 2 protein, partial [Nitrospinales bacterium]